MKKRFFAFVVVLMLLCMGSASLAVVTECVSVNSSGVQANGMSLNGNMSEDGRYVVFASDGDNLVSSDTNGVRDIFVFDRQIGITERVSVSSGNPGGQANGASCEVSPKDGDAVEVPSISSDGRYVVFSSSASNLVSGDTNGLRDVFVRDRARCTTTRISVSSSGAQANGVCYYPSISADGNRAVFVSDATNLVTGDTNGAPDVFMRDISSGKTSRVNVSSANAQAVGSPNSDVDITAWISGDGEHVAFVSGGANLVPSDENENYDVFVRDLNSNTTECVHISTSGEQGNGFAWAHACYINYDGSIVTFSSDADNLVPGDINGAGDVFVRDRNQGTTTRVSGAIGGGESIGRSVDPTCSSDGSLIGFAAWNLDETSLACYIVQNDGSELQQISVDNAGSPLEGINALPLLSSNGRYAAFFNAPSISDLGAGKVMFVDREAGSESKVAASEPLASAIPTLVSVSPASGIAQTGVWKTFTCIYSDANTASDLTKCKLVINSIVSGSGGAYLTYDKVTNKLYMTNNAGTQVGGIVRGTAGTIQTENAVLDCAGTTVTSSGNNLTIAWKVQFKPVMAGKKCNLYMIAYDLSGGSSGWKDKGDCIINAVPTVTSVSPSSGTVQPGVWKTFTCIYSDINGATDLTKCRLLVNSIIASSNGAYFIYDRTTNKLYMNNNAGKQVGGIVRGSTGRIESENAILDCATTTATISGNNLTITWKVQFKSAMNAKSCNLYMMDSDVSGSSSGWVDKGNCIVNDPPTVTSAAPASGIVKTGVWTSFTCAYSSPKGASNLSKCRLVINSSITGLGGAYFIYDKSTDKLYMVNNAGQQIGGIGRGDAGTIETENAILDCAGTSAISYIHIPPPPPPPGGEMQVQNTMALSENDLIVTWRVQIKPAMAGKRCNLYMTATDILGSSSGWKDMGDCMINAAPTVTSVSPAVGSVLPGVWKTFTCTYSDLNGAADLTKCRLLINTTIASAGGAYFMYDRTTNKLYMNNNSGKQVGGVVRGTATTIQSENAILHCGNTTVTSSGNKLTIAWKVQFKPTMAGKNCNLYMMATDVSGVSQAWVNKGTVSITPPG